MVTVTWHGNVFADLPYHYHVSTMYCLITLVPGMSRWRLVTIGIINCFVCQEPIDNLLKLALKEAQLTYTRLSDSEWQLLFEHITTQRRIMTGHIQVNMLVV